MIRNQAPPGQRGLFAGALIAILALAAGSAATGRAAASDDFEFAVIQSGNNTTMSVGDLDHQGALGRLQDEAQSTGRPLFWFSKSGREYVVRDAAIVGRARTIVEPMSALGEKQGKLGAKQGKLGARQGKIGGLQARAGLLEARIALNGLAGDAQARAENSALRVELRDLSRQIEDLAREQRALGETQRMLGAQQAELGRRQAVVSRTATSDLRDLAEDAIASGAAQRLRD